jgi:hypothetical protein
MQELPEPATGNPIPACDPVLVATLAEALALLFRRLLAKEGFLIIAEEEDHAALFDLLTETEAAAESFLGVIDTPLGRHPMASPSA